MGSQLYDIVLGPDGIKAILAASKPGVLDSRGADMGYLHDLSLLGAVQCGVRMNPDAIRPAMGADAAVKAQVNIGRLSEAETIARIISSTDRQVVLTLQGWAAPVGDLDENRLAAALNLYGQVAQTLEAKGSRIGGPGASGEGTGAKAEVTLTETLYEREQGFTWGYFEARVVISYRAVIRQSF